MFKSLAKLAAGLAVALPLFAPAAGLASQGRLDFLMSGSPPGAAAAAPRQTAKDLLARPLEGDIDAWFAYFAANKELFLYSAMAFFGILLVTFAIGGGSAAPRKTVRSEIDALKKEKERAEHLANLKAEFLNQVSHELRTPLAVIIGYIECITDGLYGKLDEKHMEILQIVAKQSGHLKNMIDQILIYSRLEANKQPIRSEEIDMAALVAEMKDSFEFLCRRKGIEMRWNLPHGPLRLRNDATRVKEVVSNLLQNAVKYTDRGSVTLTVTDSRAADMMIVEVRDTGIGISHLHIGSIFEPFMQVHKTSTENSRGGIGLGLSIVKKHIEQLDGKIEVDSELGRGSTFRVAFPKNLARSRSRVHRLLGLRLPLLKRFSRPPALSTPQLHGIRQHPAKPGHNAG